MVVESRYPAYRQPKMRWLPAVPEHWNEQRAKTFFREVDERSKTGQEELLSVSHLTGVTPRSQKKVTMFKAASYVGAKLCRPGDIVINTLWAWMAALGASRHVGIVSPAYGVYRPHHADSFNPAYLDYLLRTSAYVAEYIGRSTGIQSSRLRLYPNQFLDIPLLQPPRPEQDQIVAYLRVQDAHIARFIKAKRELIGLLQEQKKNLIQRALTNGIKEGVRTKPSGVEWIGEMPAHWEVKKLKQAGRFGSGAGFPIEFQGETSFEIPFFKVSDMTYSGNEFQMLATKNSVSREQAAVLGAKVFPSGSTIFPKVGGALLTNKRRLLVRDSCVDNNVMAFVPFSGNPEYWYWVLTMLDFGKLANPGPVPALNASTIKDLSVPYPDDEEQDRIVEHIRALCLELNAGISLEKRGIELIREYRDRLIADVVTGQVDVRGWQPGPDDLVDDAVLAALDDDQEDATAEEDGDGED